MIFSVVTKAREFFRMDRLLRLGGQGMGGMGSQSPESSQNDTAEQVLFSRLLMLTSVSDSYLFIGLIKNDETWSCWCSI